MSTNSGHTWSWYRGRVRYEMRWLPWWIKRVAHGESRWYAPIRGLWHSLMLMYDSELCAICGHPVGAVWHAEDELWLRTNGGYGGTTCMSCFNKQARRAGNNPCWEVHDGEFPTCSGSPCVHVAPMMVQAEAAEECWQALVSAVGEDAAREAVGMSTNSSRSIMSSDTEPDPRLVEYRDHGEPDLPWWLLYAPLVLVAAVFGWIIYLIAVRG